MKEKRRILNNDIRSKTIQLISDDWENFWEMHISEARTKARDEGLDLMEMWRKWPISIVKILDYGKFLYKQKKQEQKNKAKWRAPDLKTLRITFKIWDHDLDIRRNQAKKFATLWHPLKVTLMLRWRENQYGDLAYWKMEKFIWSLSEFYKLEWQIKRSGNTFNVFLKVLQ